MSLGRGRHPRIEIDEVDEGSEDGTCTLLLASRVVNRSFSSPISAFRTIHRSKSWTKPCLVCIAYSVLLFLHEILEWQSFLKMMNVYKVVPHSVHLLGDYQYVQVISRID